jgi:hypothetical protein
MSVFTVFGPEIALLELVEREIGHHPTSCLEGEGRRVPRRVPIGGGDFLDLSEISSSSLAALMVARILKWGMASGLITSRVLIRAWSLHKSPIQLSRDAREIVSKICCEIASGIEEYIVQTGESHQPWDLLVDQATRSTGLIDRLTLEEQATLVCAKLGSLPSDFHLYASGFGGNTYSKEVYDHHPDLPELGDILWEIASLVLAREGPKLPTGDCSPLNFHEVLKKTLGRFCANCVDIRQGQTNYKLIMGFTLDSYPWEQRTAAEMDEAAESRKRPVIL